MKIYLSANCKSYREFSCRKELSGEAIFNRLIVQQIIHPPNTLNALQIVWCAAPWVITAPCHGCKDFAVLQLKKKFINL